jgi:NTP pyrophosphatase (non-canonical NTP hydrolase)
MEHYNQLSPSEAERLAWLSEECGEVIQAVGKILRHGYDSRNPLIENGPSNREHLEKELGHLWNVIHRMLGNADVSLDQISRFDDEKTETVGQFLHHQN